MKRRLDVWPPLAPGALLHGRADPPFPLSEPGVVLFARARDGLLAGVRALGLRPGDEVLTPAYHHGSEVEALLAAGLVPRFYDATPTLAPAPAELDALHSARTRALYLTHHLGFPQDVAGWRRYCDERRLLLLEDAAQAWLASTAEGPVGAAGDLAIWCLYKTFGLPDGAALLVRSGGEPDPPAGGHAGAVALAGRLALWLAGRSAAVAALLHALERDGEYRPEQDFALGDAAPPASCSTLLLARLGDDAAARRRDNYRVLLAELSARVPEPFDRLPAGASPFAFPIESDGKRALLERLARQGIRAADLWSVGHLVVPRGRFPAAEARRATTVALPVHQELRPADLDAIVDAVLRPPGRRAPALDWFDDPAPLETEWRRLAAQSGNVFVSWEWATLWWRRFGMGGRLRVAACRRPSGEVFALLPLYVWRDRPLRIVRLLGHGAADELGPVCAPRDRVAAARCLRLAIAELNADALLAERMLATEAWPALIGGAVVRREAYPLINGFDGWEGYAASRSAHLRRKLGGQERRLARERGLRYRLAGDRTGLPADLDTLFALHRSRWPDGSGFTSYERFHREFAATALDRGWLRLWFLELEGEAAAAWYGFRYGDTESHFQSGRDTRFERESVGSILLLHTIREALRDGVCEYRFLRGGEPYKHRFATADPGIVTVLCARGPAGRAAVAASAVAASIGPVRAAARAALEQSPAGRTEAWTSA